MCVSTVVQVVERRGEVAVVHDDRMTRLVPLTVLTASDVEVVAGDWLLVNSGIAVERLDPDEAASICAALEQARRSGT